MIKIIIIRGGLGNQLFGYAFYLFLKKQNKFSYVKFDIWESLIVNKFILSKVFPKIQIKRSNYYHNINRFYKYRLLTSFFFVVNEQNFPGEKNKLLTLYDGFWQSNTYFEVVSTLVKDKFTFNEKNLNNRSLNLAEEIKHVNSVSIHMRRGDYLDHEETYGNICNINYYKRAISYVSQIYPDVVFYIFSDDPAWVRQNFNLLENPIIVDFNTGENSWQDMFLMSKCKHNIIANSTFSWWGAWLNNNPYKIVISPSRWMNINKNINIIPSDWIKIEV